MGMGLVALIPVLGIAGGVLVALGVGAETVGWMTLGIAVAWIVLITWWALRAPAARSEEASSRYWAALRHSQYQPQHHEDHVQQRR